MGARSLVLLLLLSLQVGCGSPSKASSEPDPEAPLEPPAGFWDHKGRPALLLSIKGLINPYYEPAQAVNATYAQATARALLPAEQTFKDHPQVYRFTYAKNAPSGLAGKSYLITQAYSIDSDTSHARTHLLMAQLAVPDELLAGSEAVLELDTKRVVASVRDITLANRADQVSMTKDCTLGTLDRSVAGGLRVDRRRNASFDTGETLIA